MTLSIEAIAHICHETNRVYCEAIGDASQPLWSDAPEWQRSSAMAGVVNIREGVVTKPSDSHESWLREKRETGWVFGPVKDPAKKEHPCMVEHDQLPPEQQVKDVLFFNTACALLSLA